MEALIPAVKFLLYALGTYFLVGVGIVFLMILLAIIIEARG